MHFNNVRSKDDCETLMQRVSWCVDPFICTHGRQGVAMPGGVGEGGLIEVKAEKLGS